jgi:hypothetical protein
MTHHYILKDSECSSISTTSNYIVRFILDKNWRNRGLTIFPLLFNIYALKIGYVPFTSIIQAHTNKRIEKIKNMMRWGHKKLSH